MFRLYNLHVERYAKLPTFESQKRSCMNDSPMESEERRKKLRRRNQRDRDRRAAESAHQKETRLARRRVGDRAHRASRSAAQWPGESFGLQERACNCNVKRCRDRAL